ncbi:hypothetical protein AAHC03_025768 [Spirometra sp. Aus1]|nr:unnamed protein product [Spirometra erinaceieuropaei]
MQRVIFILFLLLLALSSRAGGAVAKLEVSRMTWRGFITLVSTLLEIDNKIDVSPTGNLLLQLGQVKGVHVRRCKTVVVGNPNCQSQRNVKLLCPFTCEHLNVSLYQKRPLVLGALSITVEHREEVSLETLAGHITGELQGCCLSEARQMPISAPYVYAIAIDSIQRINTTPNSSLELLNAEGMRGFVNAYFSTYLREYLYAPSC